MLHDVAEAVRWLGRSALALILQTVAALLHLVGLLKLSARVHAVAFPYGLSVGVILHAPREVVEKL